MVVFLGPYPEAGIERDGMVQRVAAIDSIFSELDRLYLNLSFRRHAWREVRGIGSSRLESVNFFLHHNNIVQRLEAAKLIYIHTVYHAKNFRLFLRKYGHKTVLDLHGIVPEEELFFGRKRMARLMQRVERVAIQHSRLVIVVTHRMGQYLLSKYPRSLDSSRIVILPNLDSHQPLRPLPPISEDGHGGLRLIYAGGVQKWQNVDLMLQTLQRLAKLRQDARTSLFVPPEAVQGLAEKVRVLGLQDVASVGSRTHEEVLQEYESADAGFVLRDDLLLNQVAMPTKLVEYMTHGVVPIVRSPDLGDFMRYNYAYLALDAILDQETSSRAILNSMRARNQQVIASVVAEAHSAQAYVKSLAISDKNWSPGSPKPVGR
jgi:glycosyltransferase involved in cell wall biosynthesis